MNETLTPEQLREAFLAAADPSSARVLALTCSLLLVTAVLWLVYRRELREEYTPIGMGVALALVLVSVICLNYAVRLSRTGVEIKNLAQEVALLRARLERLDPGERLAG